MEIIVYIKATLLLCLGLWLPLSVSADADFPPPPDATVVNISSSTTSIGMQLQIRRFQVDMSLEEVLSFYRTFWKDGSAEADMSGWKMIGSRQGNHYLNVQVKPNGRNKSWGFLSVSDLPQRLDNKNYSVQMGGRFPMMSGSQILDDQLSDDIGKEGRTLLIVNKFTPKSNLNFYRKHYRNQGWNIVMDEQTQPRSTGFALYVNKGQQSVGITVNKLDGQTSIVANHVKRGLIR